MSVARLIEVGTSGWHDQLDVLAADGTEEQKLAVWAARCADAAGDPVEAARWAAQAALTTGRLF